MVSVRMAPLGSILVQTGWFLVGVELLGKEVFVWKVWNLGQALRFQKTCNIPSMLSLPLTCGSRAVSSQLFPPP